MMLRKLVSLVAIVGGASALFGCIAGEGGEALGSAQQGMGGVGTNNVSPQAIAALSLSRGVTNDYGITTTSDADPLQLCIASTVTSTGCTMRLEWESWLNDAHHGGANATAHAWMMKGIVKCAAESSFTIQNSNGSHQFPGQWPLYPSWKTGQLMGQPEHERVSACILTLLNGNDESLELCIIGPGGTPFSDACDDPTINIREGGFFGDLFGTTPSAYVVGPDSAPADINGRDCYASVGTYCCAESDTSCKQHIILAGGMTGSNSRCDGFAMAGSNQYCTSFWSTREPGRTYSNGFTTFIPPAR